MFVLQWLMGITIWVANTITGRLRRPLPSSPCTASGMAVRQASLLGKSVKKGKLGSVSLNLAQNWSSVFPNSAPWSSKLCPPKNMCPPLDKLHRAQSEGFRTGYFTWRAGFFREVRHKVSTLLTLTGNIFLSLRISPCKFRHIFLSAFDRPHRASLFIRGSYIP